MSENWSQSSLSMHSQPPALVNDDTQSSHSSFKDGGGEGGGAREAEHYENQKLRLITIDGKRKCFIWYEIV